MRDQKGITLVALIITIIVMLILVAVTISVALNGGLFANARDAAEKTIKEQAREAATVAKAEIITNYFSGKYANGTADITPAVVKTAIENYLDTTEEKYTVETPTGTYPKFTVTIKAKNGTTAEATVDFTGMVASE